MPLDESSPPPVVFIPEVRDYQRINAELVGLLDAGHRRVLLEGAEGQRLIASGLVGRWEAVVEIVGRTGPELGAGLNAPGLTILARHSTADGLASGMRSGRVVLAGDAGEAAGYSMAGGDVLVGGTVGHRAGLNQSGGTLSILGTVGRLAGERQSGGRLFLPTRGIGPESRGVSWGSQGGEVITFPVPFEGSEEGLDTWQYLVGQFLALGVKPLSQGQAEGGR